MISLPVFSTEACTVSTSQGMIVCRSMICPHEKGQLYSAYLIVHIMYVTASTISILRSRCNIYI